MKFDAIVKYNVSTTLKDVMDDEGLVAECIKVNPGDEFGIGDSKHTVADEDEEEIMLYKEGVLELSGEYEDDDPYPYGLKLNVLKYRRELLNAIIKRLELVSDEDLYNLFHIDHDMGDIDYYNMHDGRDDDSDVDERIESERS